MFHMLRLSLQFRVTRLVIILVVLEIVLYSTKTKPKRQSEEFLKHNTFDNLLVSYCIYIFSGTFHGKRKGWTDFNYVQKSLIFFLHKTKYVKTS